MLSIPSYPNGIIMARCRKCGEWKLPARRTDDGVRSACMACEAEHRIWWGDEIVCTETLIEDERGEA